MFLYWGKRFDAEQAGERIVSVACNKCGCEYFYRLTRIGTGSETAPYGIGTGRVTRSAQEQSKRDLERRLTLEADLVPCPSCNWINDDLVRGYRLGRYRKARVIAAGVCFVGTIGSLLIAWIIHQQPADRGAVPYFLYGGPLLFAFFAAALILLRNWLRRRIRPNRDFPQVPKLPIGVPPALLKDTSSGELLPVKTREPCFSDAEGWLDFQFGRDQFPLLCCDCLQNGNAEHAHICQVTAAITLAIPRCDSCERRNHRLAASIMWITAALSLLVGAATAALLGLESTGFWCMIATSLFISVAFGVYASLRMAAPITIASGDQPRGVIRLRFRNADYGRVVAEHNQ